MFSVLFSDSIMGSKTSKIQNNISKIVHEMASNTYNNLSNVILFCIGKFLHSSLTIWSSWDASQCMLCMNCSEICGGVVYVDLCVFVLSWHLVCLCVQRREDGRSFSSNWSGWTGWLCQPPRSTGSTNEQRKRNHARKEVLTIRERNIMCTMWSVRHKACFVSMTCELSDQ